MIKEKDIIKRIKGEANKVAPDVLSMVLNQLGLEKPKAKRNYFTYANLGLATAGVSLMIVGALILPSITQNQYVASAETYVKVQIVPADLAPVSGASVNVPNIFYLNQLPSPTISPTFSFIVNRQGKTIPVVETANSGVYAMDEDAKTILAGLGLANTISRDPKDLTLDLVKTARNTGHIQSAKRGNQVVLNTTGEDLEYQIVLRQEITFTVQQYFDQELIYGVAYEDEELGSIDLQGYEDLEDQEIEQYESNYHSDHSEHEHDDDSRDSEWGSDHDSWVSENDCHGNDKREHKCDASSHGQGSQHSGSSQETSPDTSHDSDSTHSSENNSSSHIQNSSH